MNNYAYVLDGTLYLNITNRCHNACTFCIRSTGDGVRGQKLWLDSEPSSSSEVIAAVDALSGEYREAVFCGYGEPTENLRVLVDTAKVLHDRGYKVRLNTNGLGSAVAGRDIVPELKNIDVVSVSLNNCTAQKYFSVTLSQFGLKAFDEMLSFAVSCKEHGLSVVFTVVDVIGKQDIALCERLSAELGIPLRVRRYIADNYGEGER